MKHYTKEELELYRDCRMSVLGRIQCKDHLKQCTECQNIMKEIEEEDELITKLRASVNLYEELSAGPAQE